MIAFDAAAEFADRLDHEDPLGQFRDLFHIPPARGVGGAGAPEGASVYLCGNSLGCMPRAAAEAVAQELDDWRTLGVGGHQRARHPWLGYHEELRETGARLVGALPGEVVMMNSLTVNLHLMMVSFYRPTPERFRILIEDSAFPSDSYAVASQAAFRGYDPARAVVRLGTGEICDYLGREGAGVALVLLGGVNYLTGELLDIEGMTAAAHAAGAVAGWDLAHAAGNVPLRLHEWGADFAAWCSYKYLNAGPGAVGGCFVHERHAQNTRWFGEGALPRLAGWWGNDSAGRFRMGPDFEPVPSADGWQISNPPILSMAPLRVSLDIFDRVGMGVLRAKSVRLTGYLEWLLDRQGGLGAHSIITPRDPARRGSGLSIEVRGGGRDLLAALLARGIVCDFREPNVIRAAPVPLYNTFRDVWRFADALAELTRGHRA